MKLKNRVEVRVDIDTRSKIEKHAKAQGLSVSSYVRMLLLRSLAAEK